MEKRCGAERHKDASRDAASWKAPDLPVSARVVGLPVFDGVDQSV
jgi:hypothetical protein